MAFQGLTFVLELMVLQTAGRTVKTIDSVAADSSSG